jgi:quercetin dioxygenase-like cupin family protein
MRLIDFGPAREHAIDAFGSDGVTLAPLTEPLASGARVQVGCFRLEAGGRIGRHPASVPQLLAVVSGDGFVSGADGEPRRIAAGEAAVWEAGEEHETWSENGLVALVVEAPDLRPVPG